ncbi:MAG: ATP-binding protein [Acetatifactor sp.]
MRKFQKFKRIKARIIVSMLIFVIVLITVGLFMQARMRQLLYSYMEKQVTVQAEEMTKFVKERFDTELKKMERISKNLCLSGSESSLMIEEYHQYLFPEEGEGMTSGMLALDGTSLFGSTLDFSEFTGIQDAFRGNSSVCFSRDKGLLFAVPVYNDYNVKYVLYRLYSNEILAEEFFGNAFSGRADVAAMDIREQEMISFQNHNLREILDRGNTRKAYGQLQDMLNISNTASVYYQEDGEGYFMFLSDVSGYDTYLVGIVPDDVMSKGLSSLVTLVIWVFALLVLLMVIGIAYLINAEERAKESDELRMAKLVAENASRQKSTFLANMSHEIRTPINAIMGMNEMVLRECEDDSIRKYSENIQSASRLLLSLVNDVLDFSKIESGKMEIVRDTYSLDVMIHDVVNLIQVKALQKNLEFRVEVQKEIPNKLFGDELRNRQIMGNLLNNAIKYTQEGSVSLKVSADTPDADSQDKDLVTLKIQVSDTGIGIREEDMGKLFGNFERLDLEKNRNIEGTGLGLAITQKLVEAMGGTIEVTSEYGKGSIFTACLPQRVMDPAPIGEFEVTAVTEADVQGGYREKFHAPDARVLAVDDNNMNLLVVKGLLKKTKVQVITCQSGEECLELMQKEHFHIILLDHMMPGMDGMEVMKRSQTLENNKCASTPVIALTANAIKGMREMYLSAGFTDYLSKPVDGDKLEQMVRKYLPEELVHAPEEEEAQLCNGTSAGNPAEAGGAEAASSDRAGEAASSDRAGEAASSDRAGEAVDATDSSSPAEEVDAADNDAPLIDHKTAMVYCGNDEEMYREILDCYCSEKDENQEKMKDCLKKNNLTDYRILIHALKSTSLNIGCKALYNKALALEKACKNGALDFVQENHAACMELYDRVVNEGMEYLRE